MLKGELKEERIEKMMVAISNIDPLRNQKEQLRSMRISRMELGP